MLPEDAKHAGGELYLEVAGKYLRWDVGSQTAVLDGPFTAAELREIADHMERRSRAHLRLV